MSWTVDDAGVATPNLAPGKYFIALKGGFDKLDILKQVNVQKF